MKNYYAIMGIASDASQGIIKKQYRILALKYHPDKAANKTTVDPVKMALINEAYEILGDPENRKEYDVDVAKFGFDEEEHELAKATGHLETNKVPHSVPFRQKHVVYSDLYSTITLASSGTRALFKAYSDEGKSAGSSVTDSEVAKILSQNLNPVSAIQILINAIKNRFSGTQSEKIKNYFVEVIKKLAPESVESAFFHSIHQLISKKDYKDAAECLHDFWQIANYINHLMDTSQGSSREAIEAHALYEALRPNVAALFQSQEYQNLFIKLLHQHWLGDPFNFNLHAIKPFTGLAEAESKLAQLNTRLSNAALVGIERETLRQTILGYQNLARFEKKIDREVKAGSSPDALRESAFAMLDCIPTLGMYFGYHMITNVYLQSGVYLQLASLLDKDPVKQMADETLALDIYMQAVDTSREFAPGLELYALVHSLKFISAMRYRHELKAPLINVFQKRCIYLASVYPFFDPVKCNAKIFITSFDNIALMRMLLETFVSMFEMKKSGRAIVFDHEPEKILYLAYDASIQGWLGDSRREEILRVLLMDEMLKNRRWSYEDINKHVDAMGIMIPRTHDGWMRPSRRVQLPDHPSIEAFQSVEGLQINLDTGEVGFSFRTWNPAVPPYKQLVTVYDLNEMMTNGIVAGFFSLDQPNNNMQFHPFNEIRFAPSSLYQTQLWHSMLVTDYLLKFFTVHAEVRARPPYDRSSLDSLIMHLPDNLKKIIEEFRDAPHEHSLHRFWIEAHHVSFANEISDKTLKVALGEMKMVVKKHQMERAIDGELVDKDEEDEGWDLYVFTKTQFEQVQTGIRVIKGDAIIFIKDTNKAYFIEENVLNKKEYLIEDYSAHLAHLFKAERDSDDKVCRNAKNSWLNYRVTRDVTRRFGKMHKFSSEYIFAQEFTAHYNEYAQYFPAFGRLRELSKMAVIVGILRNHYQQTLEQIETIKEIINNENAREKPGDDFHNLLLKNHNEICQDKLKNLTEDFTKINEGLQKAKREQEKNLEENFQKLEAAGYITEAAQYCKIYDMYDHVLKHVDVDDYRYAVQRYVNGYLQRLKDAVYKYELEELKANLVAQFDSIYVSSSEIESALEYNYARLTIARRLTNKLFYAQLYAKQRLATKLSELGLPSKEVELDLKDKCLWVPANMARRDKGRGFVYGGVSVFPERRPASDTLNSIMINAVFTGDTNVLVDNTYIKDAREVAATVPGPSANFIYNLRLQEVMAAQASATAASSAFRPIASASGVTGGGARPPVGGTGGGATGGGSGSNQGGGGGRRPPTPPDMPPAEPMGGAGDRKPNAGAGVPSGPAGRPPSPSVVFAPTGQGAPATQRLFYEHATLVSEHDRHKPGPIENDNAMTFSGEKYKAYRLDHDFVLYRAGASTSDPSRKIGEFYSFERPVSELQARMDKAVREKWPTGGKSVLEIGYAVKIPKGTVVYVGETASQGGIFMGGTNQVCIPEAWTIPGVEIFREYELVGGMAWNAIAKNA